MTRKCKCVKCGLCSNACPFGFNPPKDAHDGLFRNPDCIHCRRCIDRCPRHALGMDEVAKGRCQSLFAKS